MKNQVDISTNGVNVHVSSAVRASFIGKVVLTIMNISVLAFYIFMMSIIEKEETVEMLIHGILFFLVFVFFPWKYWFWNFYGKENILINTKTLRVQLDYGIIRTKPKVVSHNKLAIDYEFVREIEGIEYGKMRFISHNIETNLPELIWEARFNSKAKD